MLAFFRGVVEILVVVALVAIFGLIFYHSVVALATSPLWKEVPSRDGISVPPASSPSGVEEAL